MTSSPADQRSLTEGIASSRLRAMSLRSRIYLSCGLLVALCLVTSTIGFVGQRLLLRNVATYERIERIAQQSLAIDRTIPELTVASQRFLNSGAQSQYRRALSLVDNVLDKVEETQQTTDNTTLQQLANDMRSHLNVFRDQLELAAEERNLRTTLVQETLPAGAEAVFQAILDVRESLRAARPEGGEARADNARLDRFERHFVEGRAALSQYLVQPKYSSYETMIDEFAEAKSTLEPLSQKYSSGPTGAKIEQLNDAIKSFEDSAMRTFQATRGYLYYSNVVMAGEISEFVYYSNRIKDFVESEVQVNRELRSKAASRMQSGTIFASIAALMSAAALAVSLSYSIVSPLTNLTSSFRRLADGETIASIPGTERSDEIGRMAKAAKVFSQKNDETKLLLSRANSLSEELKRKAAELEETNRELDNFAYVASHDLKSPLRGIDNLAEWVAEDCDGILPDSSQKHLQLMRDRVAKMNDLLTELLEYSRVGRTGLTAQHVDLNELIQSTIGVLDNPNGVKIVVPSDLPQFETALTLLKQTFLNLFQNALKYNDKGESGRVELKWDEEGEFYRFEIADNGIGVDPDHHERIFQLYQRVAPELADGSGMGLAIVRKSIESFGGNIRIESQAGGGARFIFTWPKNLA